MTLQRFVSFYGLIELQRKTGLDIVPDAFSSLLVRLESEEYDYLDALSTKYSLFDPDIELAPEEFVIRNAVETHSFLIDATGCIATDKSLGLDFAKFLEIVTAPLTDNPSSIQISGTLFETEPGNDNLLLPQSIDETIELKASASELAKVPCQAIVRLGPDEFVRHVYRVARAELSIDPTLNCSLHPDFWATLSKSGIDSDPAGLGLLVRSCAEVLADVAKDLSGARLEQHRVNSNPNAPGQIRTRDRAAGYRLSISMSGVAWRLHYWLVPARSKQDTRTVEFESVRKHSNVSPMRE